MPNKIDRVGQKFNMLTVIRRMPKVDKVTRWECKCDCGNVVIVTDTHLTRKKHPVKSCGCLRPNIHHMSNTRLYTIYMGMKRRCSLRTVFAYKDYGGREIKVCDEWENSFVSFYEWAMANGYDDGLSLDRIDNNGDYCPNNCRWASAREQATNRRNTLYVTFRNETKPLSIWCEELGIKYSTVYVRIHTYGWSIDKALTRPVRKGKSNA